MAYPSTMLEQFYTHHNNTIGSFLPASDVMSRMRMSWMVRSQPGWEANLNDLSVVGGWFEEVKADLMGGDDVASTSVEQKVTLAQVKKDWAVVIRNLSHYVTLRDGKMTPGPFNGSWVADGLVDVALTERLIEEGKEAEEIAIKENNWQPGSGNRVINVISPYLYCIVSRRSQILRDVFMPNVQKDTGDYSHLLHFHSDKADTYLDAIDVTRFLRSVPNLPWPLGDEWDPNHQLLPADIYIGADGKSRFTSYVNGLNPVEHGELYATLEQVFTRMVPLFEKTLSEIRTVREEVAPRTRSDIKKHARICPVSLREKRVQIVVRMATTILTPENPKHPGGQWHIEGMSNEKIVAVGLHYFSNDNITTSKLCLSPSQRNWSGVMRMIEDDKNSFAIETVPGRSIVFRNSISHRVAPFELEDPEKPGHRKILAFFLVDPGSRVLSSARIPCQRWAWYLAQVRDAMANFLPAEMVEYVVSFVPKGDKYFDNEEAKRFEVEMRNSRMERITGIAPDRRRLILRGD